jgi:hypothetical protein
MNNWAELYWCDRLISGSSATVKEETSHLKNNIKVK